MCPWAIRNYVKSLVHPGHFSFATVYYWLQSVFTTLALSCLYIWHLSLLLPMLYRLKFWHLRDIGSFVQNHTAQLGFLLTHVFWSPRGWGCSQRRNSSWRPGAGQQAFSGRRWWKAEWPVPRIGPNAVRPDQHPVLFTPLAATWDPRLLLQPGGCRPGDPGVSSGGSRPRQVHLLSWWAWEGSWGELHWAEGDRVQHAWCCCQAGTHGQCSHYMQADWSWSQREKAMSGPERDLSSPPRNWTWVGSLDENQES